MPVFCVRQDYGRLSYLVVSRWKGKCTPLNIYIYITRIPASVSSVTKGAVVVVNENKLVEVSFFFLLRDRHFISLRADPVDSSSCFFFFGGGLLFLQCIVCFLK